MQKLKHSSRNLSRFLENSSYPDDVTDMWQQHGTKMVTSIPLIAHYSNFKIILKHLINLEHTSRYALTRRHRRAHRRDVLTHYCHLGTHGNSG